MPNQRFLLFCLLSILSFPNLSLAAVGPGGTGGGRGVICRDSKGKIKSAELLDIWEAKTLYQRSIPESRKSLDQQVELGIKNLRHAFYFSGDSSKSSGEALSESLKPLTKIFLEPAEELVRLRKTKLNDTTDSEEPAVPAHCKVEQIVSFMDSPTRPKVLLNQDIYDRLSTTNRAALILHEALYAFLRAYGETNSVRVRRTVGHIFSGGSFPSRDETLRQRHLDCVTSTSPLSVISVYMKADNTLSLVQRIDRGLLMIGVYDVLPSTQLDFSRTFENDLDFVLSDDSCRNVPAEPSDTFKFFALPGQGPADFQRSSLIAAKCEKGRVRLAIGGGYRKTEPLTCKMVER